MKQTLLLAFIFFSMSLNAQSLIITTSGQPITGYDITVTPNGVFYRSSESSEAQFLKIASDSVSLVRHADGTIVNMAEQSTTTSSNSQNAPVSDTSQTVNPNDYLDHVYNREIIAKYNSPAEVIFAKESDKKEISGASIWKFDGSIVFQHYATEDSQFASKDLVVSYHFNGRTTLNVNLENISNKTIFVDLANTFIVKNKHSEPYYVPGAISSTSGTTKGGSVNLGGVAKAVGVGGTAGALASAVTVGGAKSNSETNIIYSQRVISIPPHSIYILEEKDVTPQKTTGLNSFNTKKGFGSLILFHTDKTHLLRGATVEWDESSTPSKISNYLTYSFSEDFKKIYALKSTVYIKRGVVGNLKYKKKEFVEIPKISSLIEDNLVRYTIIKWEE